jgi:ABC-type phosphate transport system permease subunit
MTSAVRIAVNNLAGVPSIVYGVFGLGFFCYAVGGWIDTGPRQPMAAGSWWGLAGVTGAAVAGTIVFGLAARTAPGVVPSGRQRVLGMVSKVGWLSVAILAMALLATTPYFRGFYRELAPTPRFGSKGLLWSALTLSLLTLPVVIVATEEAIAAVPRSLRQASAGCGASKWQTIQRVVLPRAAPGMMTGMILAMARGAGEVAPLMLVGAVKQTSDSVISAESPFVHLDRPFMHLGFHIYDLGFQSPDSEAARPTVWTTTLLLICIVLLLNTTAILLRGRLRKRFKTGAF